MESVLQPPPPFIFENNLSNVTSGNLSKEWEKWKKGFLIYYEACELSKKDKKVQIHILLHVIGEKCREVYEQFACEFKSIEDLIKKFDEFFLPKKNLTIERHKFFTRDQKEFESAEQYVFELNKMAATCEFKDLCSDLVRDRLICGLRDRALRERLLREYDLSLSKAVDICRLAEISQVQAVDIKTENADHHVHEIGSNKYEEQLSKQEVNKLQWINRNRRENTSQAQSSRGQTPGQRGQRQPQGHAPRYRDQGVRRQDKRSFIYNSECRKCGAKHKQYECPAYGKQCRKCNKMNHYSRMCRIYAVEEDPSDQVTNHNICKKDANWSIRLEINRKNIDFKLDTGADVNVLPKKYLSEINVYLQDLTSTSLKLHGYSGKEIKVLGKCHLKVLHKNSTYILQFIVVDVESPPIIGRYSCEELNLIRRVMSINPMCNNSKKILDEFPEVFKGLGCLPGKYKIQLKENAQPVVHPPRKLPVALRDQIKSKLIEMQKENIISKVEGPTDWVNSITVVKKPNGDLRICLDPRDLNKAIRREHFKLPTFEEMATKLSGAKYFSSLDAKNGFWHVKLHEDSTDLCTFNTAFGRFKFLRMPYGISSASEIFHKKLYEHLDHMEGVIQFVDDILVYGPTRKIHDERLRSVLKKCQEINIKLNKQKCKIGLTEIKYLGHKITQNGILPDDSHILAIKNMPEPKNVKDVERFLGLVTYVGSFVPNLSENTFILRELLKKNIEWHWDHRHQLCFDRIKKCLTNPPVLQFYSLEKPIIISVDASKNGLGACLMQDNLPVCYASKSLTKSEQSYAQIEKELYACVYACEKFYTYIYGRTDITIETDHKPLVSIINKPLACAPARLQRMLLRLQPYAFKLVYKPGKYLYIADTLSRAVAPGAQTHTQPRDHLEAQAQVCALSANNPLTDSHFLRIQSCTKDDSEMQRLIKIIKRGWPANKQMVESEIRPYWDCRDELTVMYGIVWKGSKIIIPRCLREEMLKKIHIGHLGIEKCKLRAREIMYWPFMNSQLQDYLSRCQACLTYKKQNVKEPLMQHEIPNKPWSKVGVDLFHFRGISYVLVVDYYSKYVEIAKLKTLKSENVIKKLKTIFVRHGIPEIIMSDNGPEFSSSAFQLFSKSWNFKHITSSPHYPQSNGQVERTVQTIKNLMKKSAFDNTDFFLALLEYLNTPISKDLPSPAELIYSRKVRSIIPRLPESLKPKIFKNIVGKFKVRQEQQKHYYDKGSRILKPLDQNQNVKIRLNNEWVAGKIVGTSGPRSYLIKMDSGSILRRNRRHIIVDSAPPAGDDSSNKLYSSRYDDIQTCPPVSSSQINSENAPCPSSSVPNQTSNTNYYTRYGRKVIRPDRWGHSDYAS